MVCMRSIASIENEIKMVMDDFRESGKTMQEVMTFLDVYSVRLYDV